MYRIQQESALKTLTVHEINLYQQGEIFVKHAIILIQIFSKIETCIVHYGSHELFVNIYV